MTTIDDLRARITDPADDPARAAGAGGAAERWSTRAKPPGALGRVEDAAIRVAAITGRCPPAVPERPAVVVFAGDHGVVADGASAWPSEVTAAMVQAMAGGGAAVNAFAATVGATLTVVDVGVASPLPDLTTSFRDAPDVAGDVSRGPERVVLDRRVRAGTASIAREAAMTRAEAEAAVLAGASVADDVIEAGADLLVGGDMGIGNTTSSAALVAWATGTAPDGLVGLGAGLPADGLDRKRALVRAAVHRARDLDDPLDALAEIGGLEIAALAGLHLAAAARRLPTIVDGVIGAAALCVADAIAPGTAAHAIGGHRSVEPASAVALAHLGITPLLDLDLRLGEGTGACLAIPLVQAACRALRDMADLPA
ncbi:MAG TPA: nicotinate-nucleotide--dimethylbenzimidazole phosphoribosyltransferase [Acidimicrobiales bacterium]|nr:nicotinate-nucleotide--dimethylbenzimidazole phosphoribosyltransferase [Acidimicrobiales bacterium]